MPPKVAASNNRLSFKSQSKPKSSFSTTAKAKSEAIKTQSLAKASLTTSATKQPAKAKTIGADKKSAQNEKENAAHLPNLDVDDSQWDQIWRHTKKQMNLPASKSIHLDHENRIEQILRVFDLDPNYGPTIGLTRLERWERAQDLDLAPPSEVYQILTTKQGKLDYANNILTNHEL